MQLGLDVDLATEHEIEELFQDCVLGAIPPVGECYGLDTVVDDSIEDQPEVYLEGGDHATLVHMSHAQFASLTATARHGSFSVHGLRRGEFVKAASASEIAPGHLDWSTSGARRLLCSISGATSLLSKCLYAGEGLLAEGTLRVMR
jgi:hypothetical protein